MPVRVAVFIDGANVYRAFKTVFGWTRYSPLQFAAALAAHEPGVRGILSEKAPDTSRSTGRSSTVPDFHKESSMAERPPDALNEIGVLKRRDIDTKFTRTQTIMQGASHCDFRF